MSNDILFKRASAIEEVKSKLIIFADIMVNGYQTIVERVPSFTTSVLSMPKGSGSGIGLGEKVTQAIGKEIKEHEFIKEYSSIISTLSAEQQQIIYDRYFNNFKFKDLENGTEQRASNGRIYKKLNEIYTLIACLDDQIDFNFYDYVEAKKSDMLLSNEKKEITKIKEQVIVFIRPLLFQKDITPEKNLCMMIIDLIPKPEKETLLKYFEEQNKFTSYDYRRTTRALYTFAFLHPKIEMSETLFISVLKRSGNGWKRYLEEVKKQSSSFAWKKGGEEIIYEDIEAK